MLRFLLILVFVVLLAVNTSAQDVSTDADAEPGPQQATTPEDTGDLVAAGKVGEAEEEGAVAKEGAAEEEGSAEEEETAEEEESAEEEDDADLDDHSYEEDDDDFVPTEEIPADQAIPFPSDI